MVTKGKWPQKWPCHTETVKIFLTEKSENDRKISRPFKLDKLEKGANEKTTNRSRN